MGGLWAVVAVAVFIVVGLIVAIKKSNRNVAEQAQSQPVKYTVGDKINSGSWIFCVTAVENTQELKGKWEKKTENNFVVVHIECKNISNSDNFLDGKDFVLRAGNSSYTLSSAARCLDDGLIFTGIIALGSGLSAKYTLVFETPIDVVRPLTLYVDRWGIPDIYL